MKKHIYVFCIFPVLMLFATAWNPIPHTSPEDEGKAERLTYMADSLRREYRFQEALQFYRAAASRILEARTDSASGFSAADSILMDSIEAGRVMAENGMSMKQYVSEPVVVARHVFSIDDFYLFYPMEDSSWRAVPNQLDSVAGHRFVKATYIPEGSTDIYFSAQDRSGVRNIYHTGLEDSLWTVPSLLDESLTSSGDEIFPVLSQDGNTLYFASSGLYGVGGYDLYKSEWDASLGTWGTPENLGFPYSSPYDDLLYFNDPEGKYTLFASNRDCPADSVAVYVLEYDSMPVRRQVEDPQRIEAIASLVPVNDPSKMDADAAVQEDFHGNADMIRYMDRMNRVRSLRDSVALYGQELEEKRNQLSVSVDPDEKERLTAEIVAREKKIPALQDSLAEASGRLQQIEMEFLFNGVVIDPDKVMAQADREVVGTAANYVFSKCSSGKPLDIRVARPEVKFDYSFMVLPEGRFAQDNSIPDGIVYQIQMFLLSSPATVSQLKGLSPVFSEKTPTGKYIYRVGLFRTYNDVLANLNTVKRLGFRSAFIVAFNDGGQLSVHKARELEAGLKEKEARYQVRIVSPGEALPDITLKAIRQVTDRDIAKAVEDGKTVFLVGPLDSEADAGKLCTMVRISGIDEVETVKIEN